MRNYRGKSRIDGEWLYGYYTSCYYLDGAIEFWIEMVDDKKKNTESTPVDPLTVGQYTGIYTTDEIEGGDTECTFIYEGDIVEPVLLDGTHKGFSWGKQVVVFDRGAFCLKDRRGQITPMCNYAESVQFMVRGNVWDNPELLEGVDDA